MEFKNKFNNRVCDNTQNINNRIVPVVYTGMENKCATVYFNDYFYFEPIYSLITDLDSIRQVGSYSKLTLYFSSGGGLADCLFTLSDYFNQIDDIEIDLVVSGMVASAGFYILLMIDNPNINIIFNDISSGIIHLSDTFLSSRGMLSKDDGRYNWDKFRQKESEKLNNYFKINYINKLKLSKEDRKRLNQGQDLHLDKKELEDIVYSFQERRYFESEEFLKNYADLKFNMNELQDNIEELKDKYKKITGKELTD